MLRRRGILYVAVLLGLSLNISLSSGLPSGGTSQKGPCVCGIFGTKDATAEEKPVISKSYMNVTCNNNGTQLCYDLCTSLAKASRERATQALCLNLEHAVDLVASLYTKACDEPWKYSGITADEAICCHEKKVIGCKGASVRTTTQVS